MSTWSKFDEFLGDTSETQRLRFKELMGNIAGSDPNEPSRPILHVGVPLLLAAVAMWLCWQTLGWEKFINLQGMAFLTFVSFGKFIVLVPYLDDPLSPLVPFTPYQLAGLVVFMDIFFAMLIGLNLRAVYKVPLVGGKLVDLIMYGQSLIHWKPAIKKWASFGVIAFVTFPLGGTGAIGGTILGRLLGFHPYRVVLMVGIGAVLGAFGMAWGAESLAPYFEPYLQNPLFKWSGIAIIVVIIAFLNWRMNCLKREIAKEE